MTVGLNLTVCNNVILVDMWWNPALEVRLRVLLGEIPLIIGSRIKHTTVRIAWDKHAMSTFTS